MLTPQRVLITGAAGFVGFHLAQRLLKSGCSVLGVDNLSPYYDPNLKAARLAQLDKHESFAFEKIDISDRNFFAAAWSQFSPSLVIHLAAQAGVRSSIDNPDAYISSNLVGTFNVLELARNNPVTHLLMASSSSVYGANSEMPFKETERTALPLSLYAATKTSGESMAHAYAHLFRTPITLFRFFTVYGPWGRPDMAYFKFTEAILEGKPIDIYNHGESLRDFTYIDDLIEAIIRLIEVVPGTQPPVAGDSLSPVAPHRVVNIGQAQPTGLMDFIEAIECAVGKLAEKRFLPKQPGDVDATYASSDLLLALTGYAPSTPLETGVLNFVDWYHDHVGDT